MHLNKVLPIRYIQIIHIIIYTGKYEKSTTYYDFVGSKTIRIDWINHGYANHVDTVYYTIYNAQCRDGITIRWD